MPNLNRIPEAIADLDVQEVLNITKTAAKYGLCAHTLGNCITHCNPDPNLPRDSDPSESERWHCNSNQSELEL